jgi:hypothetical protein
MEPSLRTLDNAMAYATFHATILAGAGYKDWYATNSTFPFRESRRFCELHGSYDGLTAALGSSRVSGAVRATSESTDASESSAILQWPIPVAYATAIALAFPRCVVVLVREMAHDCTMVGDVPDQYKEEASQPLRRSVPDTVHHVEDRRGSSNPKLVRPIVMIVAIEMGSVAVAAMIVWALNQTNDRMELLNGGLYTTDALGAAGAEMGVIVLHVLNMHDTTGNETQGRMPTNETQFSNLSGIYARMEALREQIRSLLAKYIMVQGRTEPILGVNAEIDGVLQEDKCHSPSQNKGLHDKLPLQRALSSW